MLEAGMVPALIRFLSLRLKPKAAAAPRAGRGPGTDAISRAGIANLYRTADSEAHESEELPFKEGKLPQTVLHDLVTFPKVRFGNAV